jgi:hypothetical protein
VESRVLFAAGVGLGRYLDPALLALANADDVLRVASEQDLQLDIGAGCVAVTVRAKKRESHDRRAREARLQNQGSRLDLHFVEGTFPVTALDDVTSVAKRVGSFSIAPIYAPSPSPVR